MVTKHYKILKVEEEIHSEVKKMQHLMSLRDEKDYTISEVIESMIALVPKVDIGTIKSKK